MPGHHLHPRGPRTRRSALALAALVGVAAGAPAGAQETGSSGWTLEPSLRIQQTLTDNAALSSTDPHSEGITEISPGVRMSSRAGRLRGTLDYSLGALIHARDSSKNALRNSLSALATAGADDDPLSFDARASVSQQTVSAFGVQAGGTGLVNDNSTEVAALTLSPSLRGRLAGVADVNARLSWQAVDASSTDLGDSTTLNATLGISGQQGLFGWGVNASREVNDPKVGQRIIQDLAIGSLSFAPDIEWRFALRGGVDASEVSGRDRNSTTTWGYGIDWIPTDRTSLSLQSDRRFFGRSHSFTVRHRLARTLFSYTDSRGLSGGNLLEANARSLIDLFQGLYELCLRAGQTPVFCEAWARGQLGLGQGGNAGFLNSTLSLLRSQVVSATYSGLRSALTMSLQRSDNQRIDGVSYATGDLSVVNRVRQSGWSLGLTHRLTPDTSLGVTTSRQRTADSGQVLGNEQRIVTATLSSTLGPHATGSLTLRHVEFDGPLPYNESAVIGSIAFRF